MPSSGKGFIDLSAKARVHEKDGEEHRPSNGFTNSKFHFFHLIATDISPETDSGKYCLIE